MLQASVVIFAALAYIGLLFAIASFGDRLRPTAARSAPRPLIYSLSLAVYCTSWTFFGSVGLATTQGFDFLTIYLGPIVLMTVAAPAFLRVVRLAKANNITSIADFIAARYGKNQGIAALVAAVALAGSIPYISLQLKAVSASLLAVLGYFAGQAAQGTLAGDLALFVACAMAAFAVLFGTRHTDATEHQDGLMLAIATESIVKLAAFLAVGILVTFFIFSGPAHLWRAARDAAVTGPFTHGLSLENWITMTILSGGAFILLPRQFHVAVVENKGEEEIRRARWLFPLYLVLINLFVVPLALAGMTLFPREVVDSDMYVLAVPLAAGADGLALLAFVGGLSAATAMVIVESVALAIMISNDLVMPLLLRRRAGRAHDEPKPSDMVGVLLLVRRVAIFLILLFAYLYYRIIGEVQLAQIGLLSFAAVAQVGPAFAAGLMWRRATAKGAIAGILAGSLFWAYTLMMPSLVEAGLVAHSVLVDGPFGIGLLKPTALLGLTAGPLAHGVAWSLGVNTLVLVIVSFLTRPSQIEAVQAEVFIARSPDTPPLRPVFLRWRSAVTVGEVIGTVERYLGHDRAQAAFSTYARLSGSSLDPHREADAGTVRHAEHLLAAAVGAASSRLVLSLLLRKRAVSTKAALKLLDEASAAIQYNRELLQSAIDHVHQGIAVFDRELKLVCWNRSFGEMLELPADCYTVGAPLRAILANAPRAAGCRVSHGVASHGMRRPAPGRRRCARRGRPIPAPGWRCGGKSWRYSTRACSPNTGSALSRKAAVDDRPVLGEQNLAGERHGVLFFGADVRLQALGKDAQVAGEFARRAGRHRQLTAQRTQDFRPVAVFDLQAVEHRRRFRAALAQRREQVFVLLGVVAGVHEVFDVVEHRVEEGRIDRLACIHFAGDEVEGDGDAPQVLVFFGDDAQCFHGVSLRHGCRDRRRSRPGWRALRRRCLRPVSCRSRGRGCGRTGS